MLSFKTISLPFVTLEFHEDYVISTINDGVTFESEHLRQIFEVFNDYYLDRPFVSIADRPNDYTINPNLLKQKPHPYLLGIGVVCYNESSRDIAIFESTFYEGKYKVFTSIADSVEWANEILDDYIKNAGL